MDSTIFLTISIVINILLFVVAIVSIIAYRNLERAYQEDKDYLYHFFESAWKRIVEIDTRGSFSSDDEVGWFYTELKRALDILYKKASRYLSN